MSKPINHFAAETPSYVFGDFHLDPAERLLLKDGRPISLTPKVFETLVLLVEQRGRVLEKDWMMRALWPDAVVEDVNLAHNISKLRKALGEESGGAKFIETVPKLGYRFVAPVEVTTNLVLEKVTISETLTQEEIIRLPETPAPAALPGSTIAAWSRPHQLLWPLAGVALLLVGIFGGVRLGGSRAVAPPVKSIAVLPFENHSPNAADAETLGMSFADVLATRLGRLRGVAVRPPRALQKFNGAGQEDAAIARKLQVDALVLGSLQRVEDRLRVVLRLYEADGNRVLWNGQYDEKNTGLLVLQDAVADKVVQALAARLGAPAQSPPPPAFSADADARQLYERGLYYLDRFSYLQQAQMYFRQAIEKDPNFVPAYLRLAEAMMYWNVPAPGAEVEISRALKLNPQSAQAWATHGFYKLFHEWDWAEAERDLRHALQLDPNHLRAHHWLATWLSIQGRLDEAEVELRTALALDPTSPRLLADLGQLEYFRRNYPQALNLFNQALAYDSEFAYAHSGLLRVYLRQGREAEAFEASLTWRKLAGRIDYQVEYTEETAERARVARIGFPNSIRETLTGKDPNATSPQMAGWYAFAHAELGDKKEALFWLERAVAGSKCGFAVPFIAVDPAYDGLRAEPRFQTVLRHIGLKGQYRDR